MSEHECLEALTSYQQADRDGVLAKVSRQAIHETVDLVAKLEREIEQAYDAARERIADLEAENERLKARGIEDMQHEIQELRAERELYKSGAAFVGEELASNTQRSEHYGFYWAQAQRRGQVLELSHTDEARIDECHDWCRAFAYTGPTAAPIPEGENDG